MALVRLNNGSFVDSASIEANPQAFQGQIPTGSAVSPDSILDSNGFAPSDTVNTTVTFDPNRATAPEATFGDTFGLGDSAEFNSFLGDNSITSEQFNNFTEAERLGILDSQKGLQAAEASDSSLNFGMDGLGGTILGAGQLGLGVASFIQGQEVADEQIALMKQQRQSNTDEIDRKKKVSKAANDAFSRR